MLSSLSGSGRVSSLSVKVIGGLASITCKPWVFLVQYLIQGEINECLVELILSVFNRGLEMVYLISKLGLALLLVIGLVRSVCQGVLGLSVLVNISLGLLAIVWDCQVGYQLQLVSKLAL